MSAAILVFAIMYGLGLIGMHAVARDLNGGPIKTRLAWAALLAWPITVVVGKTGDFVDFVRGKRTRP